MLRVLIGTGVLLMAVGFGAAGWQYWQTLPRPAAHMASVPAPVVPGRQSWMISPTGGLVPQAEVRAYLAQDRFVAERVLRVVRQANLADLLAEGEQLPEPVFLEVLADIRAPRLAEGLCDVLLESVAQDCAVQAGRVVADSVDPLAGTARFTLDLAYRLKESGDELPDLAAHVLRSDPVSFEVEPGAEGSASPDAALRLLLATVATACAAEDIGQACRPTRLDIDWMPGRFMVARARIAWLDPLPAGMFVAPPLDPAKGG